MIRSVELELKTISEANAREFWRVAAGRHAEQREVVGKALEEEFGGARPSFDALEHLASGQRVAKLGQVTVVLTRLSPGELDPDENLRVAFKYVKDAIADWLGLRNDRDKRVRWVYGQERTARGVYKIRIEIRDSGPGADIRVQRATQAEHEAGALLPTHPKGKPPRPRNGQAELPFVRSWAALPWEQTACETCGGAGMPSAEEMAAALIETRAPLSEVCAARCAACGGAGCAKARILAPLARFAGLDDPPRTIEYRVPREHVARTGRDTVTLHRRTFRSKSTGSCWLYETTSPHIATTHETKEN